MSGAAGRLPVEEQLRRLLRGAVHVERPEELEAKLRRKESLVVKTGFDPSAPDIHLGHAVVMRKMREFQDLGHRVVFVVGDFTGLIGDPSGASRTRPQLTKEQVQANARTYQEQACRILDRERTEIRFNSEWLGRLGSEGMIRLAAKMTVARMLERDDFRKRFDAGRPVAIHEFLYPLTQAYDSVELRADVELGGTDQLWNLLVGRDIMREYGLEPQVVLTMPLLPGLDGTEKMSKSLGNYVGIEEPPAGAFGKLMSITDELMWEYHRLLLRLDPAEVDALRRETAEGRRHPKEVKEEMALRILAEIHGAQEAAAAQGAFRRVFSGKEFPEEMAERQVRGDGSVRLVDLLVDLGFAGTRGEARRLVRQGGVTLEGERIEDETAVLRGAPGASAVLRVGRLRFARLRFAG